jgi:hypothetical protein
MWILFSSPETKASVRRSLSWAKNGAAPIPWAAWALIQILTGKVSKDEYLKKISAWKAESMGRKLFERGNAGRPPKTESKKEA